MTLWSSMSAIMRISFPQPAQHSGSNSYTCLMSLDQEARARTICGLLLDDGKSVALRGTSLLEGRLTPGAITPGTVGVILGNPAHGPASCCSTSRP
jgi:hypothetical protein